MNMTPKSRDALLSLCGGSEPHRWDWTEDMLPEGWRPLLKGEVYKNGDEYKHYSEWRVETNVSSYQTTDYCHYHTRTRRPLPTPPRMVPLGPAISRCCTCGAEWLTGEDGSHSCSVVMGRKLAKCRSGLEDAKEIVEHAQNYALTRESYYDAEFYREAGERIRKTLEAIK
jgi:hypothetical protein